MTTEAARIHPGSSVTDLMTHAAGGDKQAWDALVERYIPLVWSICRRHQLEGADARDVSQTVWQQLADQLGTLRNPTALAGWLATTTWRECDRARCAAHTPPRPGQMPEAAASPREQAPGAAQELLVAERHAALLEAFAHLPPHCQQLIAMLIQDPPAPGAQISAKLGIPARSIRQTCRNCLQMLRSHPALATLASAETGRGGQAPGRPGAPSGLPQPDAMTGKRGTGLGIQPARRGLAYGRPGDRARPAPI